ncbi:MAG: hypothetical protein HWE27_14075 [Gammaproteobacteria bacterium]|nr:hypothetical protein [Gammaproteobacteria bacterium]
MNKALKRGIHRGFYRNGPSHRDGADVTFGDIVKIFGFKSATVGNWVTHEEQQLAANLFFDALCDLMMILEVDEQVISLKGSLSIAFGSGGNKYSSAHYSLTTRTLALAKNAGAGSLAHEYFHAFDHFIASRLFENTKRNDFASSLWLEKNNPIDHPINYLLSDCFQSIFLTPNGEDPSKFFKDSLKADKAYKQMYYALPEEMAARAFEAYIQDHPYKNSFLAKGTKQSEEAKMGIYPSSVERQNIGKCFSKYFRTLGLALEQQA